MAAELVSAATSDRLTEVDWTKSIEICELVAKDHRMMNPSTPPRRRFDDDMEMEARAEKRIINAKKGHKDIPRKSSLPGAKSSRRPVDFSDSEREESEYETDGEEEDRSPARRIAGDPELDDEEEDEEHDEEEEAAADEASEEEEPNYKAKQSQRNFKRKEIESDEESPKRKPAAHRRMAVVYDSDEE